MKRLLGVLLFIALFVQGLPCIADELPVSSSNVAYVQDGRTIIVTRDLTATPWKRFSFEKESVGYPALSGHWLAYVRGEGGLDGRGWDKSNWDFAIILVDLRTDQEYVLRSKKGVNAQLDFSADGRYLSFSGPFEGSDSNKVGVYDLWEIDFGKLAGSDQGVAPHVVLDNPYEGEAAYYTDLSPTGDSIVYESKKGDESKTLVITELWDRKERLFATAPLLPPNAKTADGATVLEDFNGSPSFSFDGQKVVFSGRLGKDNYEVFVVDRDGQNLKRLTNNPAKDYAPTFLPNGDILFCSTRDDETGRAYVIYKLSLDKNGDVKSETRWGPEGVKTWYPDVNDQEVSISDGFYASKMRLSTMPFKVGSALMASCSGSKLIAGCGHTNANPHDWREANTFSDEVAIFEDGKWTAQTKKPTGVETAEAVLYDGLFISAGGFRYGFQSVDALEVYDLESRNWLNVGQLPITLSGYSAARIGDSWYLFSGGTQPTDQPGIGDPSELSRGDQRRLSHTLAANLVESIIRIDLPSVANRFRTGMGELVIETLDEKVVPARRAFSVAATDTEAILVGGFTADEERLARVDAFDVVKRTWRSLPDLPVSLFAPAATVKGRWLIVAGGFNREVGGPQDKLYTLDLSDPAKGWNRLPTTLSGGKMYGKLLPYGPFGVVFVGGHGSTGPVREVEYFTTGRLAASSE